MCPKSACCADTPPSRADLGSARAGHAKARGLQHVRQRPGAESGERDLEPRCPAGGWLATYTQNPRRGAVAKPEGSRGQAETPDPSVNTPSRPITLRITPAGQHSDGLASPRHPQLFQVHGSHGGSGDREPELLSRRSAFRAAVACPRPVPLPMRPVRPAPPWLRPQYNV